MGVLTFAVFGIDKNIARINGIFLFVPKPMKSLRRVPERVLLTLSLLGGSIGAMLGMLIFRHKTRKDKFRILVPLTLILWIVIGAWASGAIDFSVRT